MDGVGATIKTSIKDTISYLPNEVISSTEDVLNRLPIMSNTLIATYKETQVQTYSSMLPKDFKITSSLGLSKVHEIFFSKENDEIIKFKKLSSDAKFTTAKI